MEIDYSIFKYQVPDNWYKDVYHDFKKPCDASRPFCLLHECKSKECWLLITGYRGYPGELTRPAYDLFINDYDVYVPRLPGMGTSTNDFINSNSKDWLKVICNAIEDLSLKYEKVNLLGHSMGAAICAILAGKNSHINKIVFAAPSFENNMMTIRVRILLFLLVPFFKKIKTAWKRGNVHHHHYENEPKDEDYLGKEYYSWIFPKQLLEYYHLSKKALKFLKGSFHDHLLVCPMEDRDISIPSCNKFKKILGSKANIVFVKQGTHFIFYDISKEAEELAIKSIVDFANK